MPAKGTAAARQQARREERAAAESRWSDLLGMAATASDDDLPGMGYKSVFHFARVLKGNLEWPDDRAVTGEDAADYVERTFDEVRASLAVGDDAWESLDLQSESGDLRAEFVEAWDTVRVPAGESLWKAAERNARQHPVVPREHAKNPKYVRFISLAAHLQRALPPGEPIAVPVGKVAEILQVSEQMVSVYRKWAAEEGLLQEVQRYSAPRDGQPGRATRFKFALDRLNV